MGYTHYWYRPVGKDFDPSTWGKFIDDVKKLSKALPSDIILGDGLGENFFKLADNKVVFNGVGDLSHETFAVERICPSQPSYMAKDDEYFAFCKTARKPYDLMVTACLLRLKHHFPEVKVSSDGEYEEWKPAVSFVQKALNEDMTAIAKEITSGE